MQQASNQSGQEEFLWHKDGYLAYGTVMFCILTIGFVGNGLTLVVLYQREHRNRGVNSLMLNLALADIFIVALGYPIAIQANLRGISLDRSRCIWSAFVNGTVGIASIATLTEMVFVPYYGLKQVNSDARLSMGQIACMTAGAWFYGCLCMAPPLLGWNRFVLAASKVSCCPDWAGRSASDTAYSLLLVVFGFFLPLTVMVLYYYKIYSLVHQAVVPGNIAVQMRRRYSKLKIVRMTALSVVVFVLSWSPYCLVSLVAVFTGKHVITSGEAEIPELLAKASVIYNPIVYTIKNRRFRTTLLRILNVRRNRNQEHSLTYPSRSRDIFQNGVRRYDNTKRKSQNPIHIIKLIPRGPLAERVEQNNITV
ncbi:melanopsin-like isoform X2 [Stylophora pistillata]|uniref:Melanopsin n=2 Tax=Stylophora pistillata TaxID=50429 RepID=A0A2B4RLM0_STYPI|nr:melanopsin-like isoform X2 [Stylophora pistillata]PFX17165.1 Melanopsin [Stylophora pistillata]